MNTKKTLTLSIIGVLALIAVTAAGSYAFYTLTLTSNLNVTANVTTPTCASIQMTGGPMVTLSGDKSAPVSDVKALGAGSFYRYSFSIVNSCSLSKTVNIKLAPTTSSDSVLLSSLRYSVIKTSESVPTSGAYLGSSSSLSVQIVSDIQKAYSITLSNAYTLRSLSVPSGTTNFYLYLWNDYWEGDTTHTGANNNITMNKIFTGYVVVDEL